MTNSTATDAAMTAADSELELVTTRLLRLDPDGTRTAQVLRDTLDQLYDGQRTGRYRWDQLHKTEKTHCGTLVEINLHREFGFDDGDVLDYRVAGVEVDCKYTQSMGRWMIPPEARNRLCLLAWASDEESVWSLGLVRASDELLTAGGNRDLKVNLNPEGRRAIRWLFHRAPLPPNVLLHLHRPTVDKIMEMTHGTKRLNELFRVALGRRVGRGVVATVARQEDYMKRVRKNGGSRTALKPEGIIILGQYSAHGAIAESLGVPVPGSGESVAVRVAPASGMAPGVAAIDGAFWRVAGPADAVTTAPELPMPRR